MYNRKQNPVRLSTPVKLAFLGLLIAAACLIIAGMFGIYPSSSHLWTFRTWRDIEGAPGVVLTVTQMSEQDTQTRTAFAVQIRSTSNAVLATATAIAKAGVFNTPAPIQGRAIVKSDRLPVMTGPSKAYTPLAYANVGSVLKLRARGFAPNEGTWLLVEIENLGLVGWIPEEPKSLEMQP